MKNSRKVIPVFLLRVRPLNELGLGSMALWAHRVPSLEGLSFSDHAMVHQVTVSLLSMCYSITRDSGHLVVKQARWEVTPDAGSGKPCCAGESMPILLVSFSSYGGPVMSQPLRSHGHLYLPLRVDVSMPYASVT